MTKAARIMITADDVGCDTELDMGICKLLQESVITSAAVFSNYDHVAVQRFPTNAFVGIHWNISSGYCVSNPKNIKSIVDITGEFYSPTPKKESDMYKALSSYLDNKVPTFDSLEIFEELNAQLRRFEKRFGTKPDFGCMHHDLDKTVTVQEALENFPQMLQGRALKQKDSKSNATFCIFLKPYTSVENGIKQVKTMILSAINFSLKNNGQPCEIICHPGYISPSLKNFTVYTEQRFTEFLIWNSESIKNMFLSAKRSGHLWVFDKASILEIT